MVKHLRNDWLLVLAFLLLVYAVGWATPMFPSRITCRDRAGEFFHAQHIGGLKFYVRLQLGGDFVEGTCEVE